ncbi:uncharacterized protein LOC113305683 [Papaver somniferum]|uniref:uncharacterized protein LOC113305683 n=1 Tax=Papaver somniferum TaxID=3469 RepID=UPI000E6FDABC|nr:uncharacterized protein LOC113305683 [Papaver somniferum]
MFFDGSSYDFYGGAGIVFEAPKKELLSFAFKLDFECSNNVAEYEALILGLRLAEDLNLGAIDVKGDSNLVTNQISGDFQEMARTANACTMVGLEDAYNIKLQVHNVDMQHRAITGRSTGTSDEDLSLPHIQGDLKMDN